MKRHLITLMLLVLSTLMVRAQHAVLNGDLNHDGSISVEDIIMMNGVIQGGGSASTCTITCTEATQSKLLDVATTGIEPSKIKWILLN